MRGRITLSCRFIDENCNNTRKMISIKWMGVFVLCQTVFCIEQPYRLVASTTCLEMESQDRLSCVKSDEYHCLLDENYINEYEVCREWKWIPKGKCAYFNTYNRGNVDERDCKPTQGFTCAPVQHRSTESKKYDACYVKKEITTQINQISTSTRPVTSDGGNSISSNSTGSDDKIGQSAGKMVAAVVFGVLIPLLIIALIILRFKHLKRLEEFGKKDIELENGEKENLEESPPSTRWKENAQNHEKLTGIQTNISETDPLLCNENENSAGSQQSETNNVRTENSTTEYEGEEVKSSEAPSSQDHTRNRERDFETEGKHNPQLDESAGDVNKASEVTVNTETKEEKDKNNIVQEDSNNKENTVKKHDMLRKESACSTTENEDHEEIKNQNSSLHGIDSSAQSCVEPGQKIDSPSLHANGMVNTKKEEINNSSVPFPAGANSAEAIVNGRGSPKVILATDEARHTEVSYESDNSGSVNGKEELPGKEEQSIGDEGPTGGKKIMIGNKEKIKSAGDEGSTTEKEGSTDENGKLAAEKHGQTGEKQELTGDKDGLTSEKGADEETKGEKERSTDEKIKEPVPSSFEEDEPTDVFDDTAESLQKESVDKADTESCLQLFDFLNWVCTKPARKVLRSVLSKNVKKSPDDILKDASIQSELKEVLPAEYHASISSKAEDSDSIIILYSLIKKFLKEKEAPKSGWDKPVRNTDTRIGDDVERLYRVYSIIRETSDPVKVPVEGYERLLKVVCDVFTRLDSDEEFKDDSKKLSNKLQDIKNRHMLHKSEWNTLM